MYTHLIPQHTVTIMLETDTDTSQTRLIVDTMTIAIGYCCQPHYFLLLFHGRRNTQRARRTMVAIGTSTRTPAPRPLPPAGLGDVCGVVAIVTRIFNRLL